jgi:restriction endonuclease Mrr
MSTKELKERINKVLDSIPDEVLEEVLKYLKSLTNKSKDNIVLSQNLKRILEEDKNLLERLAQ